MYSHLKSTRLVLALIASLVGLAACAKYPVVVVKSTAPAPTAATPASAPAR
jgi:hypothetical protein